MQSKKIIKQVSDYYTSRLEEFGASPKGVDWNSEESQQLRFNQLLKIKEEKNSSFSILDYGCGFGSMYQFMKENYSGFNFTGFDISEAMIEQAKKLFADEHSKWESDSKKLMRQDYVVASGIFNVRLKTSDADWLNYILETITEMNRLSTKGFSFNVLTKYSDAEFMKDYLYYADPNFLFDFCKRNFSKQVALLHDYPLYEFTLLIRKF